VRRTLNFCQLQTRHPPLQSSATETSDAPPTHPRISTSPKKITKTQPTHPPHPPHSRLPLICLYAASLSILSCARCGRGAWASFFCTSEQGCEFAQGGRHCERREKVVQAQFRVGRVGTEFVLRSAFYFFFCLERCVAFALEGGVRRGFAFGGWGGVEGGNEIAV
jgi:hypothetical protein